MDKPWSSYGYVNVDGLSGIRYTELFENTSLGVFFMMADGSIMDINPAAKRLFGIDPDQIYDHMHRHPDWKVVDADAKEIPPDEFPSTRAFRSGKAVKDCLLGIYNPEKAKLNWFMVTAIPCGFDEENKTSVVCETFQDITELRLSLQEVLNEKATRYSTQLKYNRILEKSREIIFQIGLDGYLQEIGTNIIQITGYQASELIGKNVLDLYLERGKAGELLRFIREYREVRDYEIQLKKKDGNYHWVSLTAQYINDSLGQAVAVEGIMRDANDARLAREALIESEQRFSTIFHMSPSAITLTSVETGKYYDVNEIFLRDTGYTRDEIIGRTSKEMGLFVNSGDRSKLVESVDKRGYVYGLEVKARMKSGKIINTLVSTRRVTINGHPMYLSSILDIDERTKTEERVKEVLWEQMLISEISGKLVSLRKKEDVYQYIGEQIFRVAGNAYVFVSAYNELDECVRPMHLFGFSKFFENIRQTWGINPFDLKVKINEMTPDELKLYKSRKLIRLDDDPLYMLAARKVNKHVCRAAEKMLGMKSFYTMGFTWEDKLYGGIGIFLREDKEFHKVSLIETLVNQASVAIQRIYFEEQFRLEHQNLIAILAASPVGMLVLDDQKKIVEANPAAASIINKNLHEIQKGYCGDFLDCVNKDRDPRGCGFSNECSRCKIDLAITKAIEQNSMHAEEDAEFLRKGETQTRWLRFSIQPLNLSGKPHAVLALQDVTHNKLAEIALRKSEQNYRNLFEQANDAILILEPETELVLDVNERACETYGFSRDEFLGMSLKTISKNGTREETSTDGAVQKGNLGEYETVHLGKDGEEIIFLINATTIEYNGKTAVLSINRNITNRRKQELKVRESEEKYRIVAEKVTDVIWLMDLEGNSTFVTPSILQFTGYTVDEYMEQTIDERFTVASSTYGKSVFQREIISFRMNPEIRANYFFSMELEYVCKDGSTKWGELLVTPYFSAEGKLTGIHGVTRDISERKNTANQIQLKDELLRLTGDMAKVGGWEFDIESGAGFWTDEVAHIHDLDPDENISLDGEMSYYDGESKLHLNNALIEAVEKAQAFDLNLELTTSKGVHKWVRSKCEPVTVNGKTVKLRGTTQDITDLKRIQDELVALNTTLEQRVAERTIQLENSNSELEAFSYSVSHDLKAPLRAIDGFSHMLLEDYENVLDEAGKRHLQTIRLNTQKMAQLINDLLSFSQLSRSQIVQARCDMNALVKKVYADIALEDDKQRIQFELKNLPAAQADNSLMTQVWYNLISNAVKFTAKKSPPRIWISAYTKGNEIVFSVSDNGAGFDMKYYDKLFGVFQRLHPAADYPGTGVGLALVKRIINKHGGRVWAESQPDISTTFYFSLPAQ
jgi:PAS domain S-box-containing protein